MITTIDEDAGNVVITVDGDSVMHPLGSAEGFAAVSRAWLRAGWDAKHVYSFTWFGRPIIQLPEDLVRMQEVVFTLRPDIIVETGVAHGGSLIFYASILRLLGKGRVIGVDIDIRSHNRSAIEAHEFASQISLIQGDSTERSTVDRVRSIIGPTDKVLVVLDSHHSRDHVLSELRLYSKLVTTGSYIVAADGIMKQVKGAQRTGADWDWNNPLEAINDFLLEDNHFIRSEPKWLFNEGAVRDRVTYWPMAFLYRAS